MNVFKINKIISMSFGESYFVGTLIGEKIFVKKVNEY